MTSTPTRIALWLIAASIATTAVLMFVLTKQGEVAIPPPATPGEVLEVQPGDTLDRLFDLMVRVPDMETPCPGRDGIALRDTEALPATVIACVQVINTSAEPGVWRIDLDRPMSEARFFIVRENSNREVLTRFADETVPDTQSRTIRVASEPFPLASGETVEIRVSIPALLGFRYERPILTPEAAFDDAKLFTANVRAGFLSVSVLLLVFFVSFSALLKSRPARAYALYFLVLIFIIGARVGYSPLWESVPSAIESLYDVALAFFHIRFVAAFVEEAMPNHPFAKVGRSLRRILLEFLGFFIVVIVGTGLYMAEAGAMNIPEPVLLVLIGMFPGLSLLAALHANWAAIVLLRARKPGARLFALGAAILILPAVVFSAQIEATSLYFAGIYGAYFADALVFAAAMVVQTFGLRSQRDEAIAAELAASQEQLRLSETLLAAHQDLDQARRLAETHRTRLAHTSHDLRQPLMSLQLALKEADAAPPALRERLSSGLGYLREVLNESMEDGRPGTVGSARAPQDAAEPVPLSLLMANVVRMFGDEARAKGLELRAVDTDLTVHADPVALIRMLSNLVSNAVKYTETGAVLIGPRRRGGAIALEVRDSGPGMTAEEVTDIRKSYTRGSRAHAAEGEGIGLASVEALARDRDLSLVIRSEPGRGTCMAIEGLREVAEVEIEAQQMQALSA